MDKYVSIVIPYHNRVHYLKEVLDSVHELADMPYEIIVNDDASVDGSTPEVFAMRDRMSTLIIGQGHNLGLANSTNRAISCATSIYIIFVNCDVKFVRPCFKEIVSILDRPYVGCLFINDNSTSTKSIKTDMGSFVLSGIKGGCAMAYRKDAWTDVGGWPDIAFSGAADCAFIMSLLGKGYFAAVPCGGKMTENMSSVRVQCQDSCMGKSGYDCSYPKIFKMSWYDRACKQREERNNTYINELQKVDGSISNMGYWCRKLNAMISDDMKINWEEARAHGQDKWKDIINGEKLNG